MCKSYQELRNIFNEPFTVIKRYPSLYREFVQYPLAKQANYNIARLISMYAISQDETYSLNLTENDEGVEATIISEGGEICDRFQLYGLGSRKLSEGLNLGYHVKFRVEEERGGGLFRKWVVTRLHVDIGATNPVQVLILGRTSGSEYFRIGIPVTSITITLKNDNSSIPYDIVNYVVKSSERYRVGLTRVNGVPRIFVSGVTPAGDVVGYYPNIEYLNMITSDRIAPLIDSFFSIRNRRTSNIFVFSYDKNDLCRECVSISGHMIEVKKLIETYEDRCLRVPWDTVCRDNYREFLQNTMLVYNSEGVPALAMKEPEHFWVSPPPRNTMRRIERVRMWAEELCKRHCNAAACGIKKLNIRRFCGYTALAVIKGMSALEGRVGRLVCRFE